MKRKDFANLTDSQIVEYFRGAALRRAQCGFNVTTANRICDHEMGPAYEALAARGEKSSRNLLSLTNDPSPNVREDAAIFAFELDPDLCHEVFKRLIDRPGWVGIAAVGTLLHKDPEFSVEFARNAKLEYKHYKTRTGASLFSGSDGKLTLLYHPGKAPHFRLGES